MIHINSACAVADISKKIQYVINLAKINLLRTIGLAQITSSTPFSKSCLKTKTQIIAAKIADNVTKMDVVIFVSPDHMNR